MNRNIAVSIILSIVTCGIYGLIWMVSLDKELNELAGTPNEAKGWMLLVLSIVTCGIYGWIWIYKMGEKVDTIKTNAGQAAGNNTILFLVLQICGLGIVNYCIMQSTINSVVPAAE